MNNAYRIIFLLEDDEIVELPVLPEKITVKTSGQSTEKTVLELGNVNLLKSVKLRTVTFNSFFPASKIPSVSARKLRNPLWYVQKIKTVMRSKKLRVFRELRRCRRFRVQAFAQRVGRLFAA